MALVFSQLPHAVGVIKLDLVLFLLEKDGCTSKNTSVGSIEIHVLILLGVHQTCYVQKAQNG